MGYIFITVVVVIIISIIGSYLILLTSLYKKKSYIIFLFCIFSPYMAFKSFQYFNYVSVIPQAIEITWPVSMGEEPGFREGCGVAVFKVSETTLKGIETKGIKFFDGVSQARGHDDNYHKYQPWQKTPIPSNWTGEGAWFMCSVISSDLTHKITKAAKQNGAYYTTKDEGQLVLIPSLGYIVFSFYG